VVASAEERAHRRVKELQGRGQEAIYASVLEDLKQRDARDSQRAVAPLKPAVDAFLLDTSALDADQALAAALSIIDGKLSRAGSQS
jgi:cytidylate kinase